QTEDIQARMKQSNEKRWSSQPAAPSAGCTFKNPSSLPAGKLIDQLGLKGTQVGGAMVSDIHGNFMVNNGQATASDFLNLIQFIRQTALEKTGILLETEVQIVGEEA
ncbi:MAG: UDP-N-acetylenolpyruvoylglucosamine reductase, partial [Verrucomicrobia bacterium]|nr:UDP-N-acetylenolpyruvoylglucosamine reductase [Verrucomicrobiota bacterium]